MNNNNTKQLSNEELTQIKGIQDAFQQKIYQLGQLYLQKIQAESALKYVMEQETKLKSEWNEIQITENELVDKLLAKYGNGSLNLKEGIFVPDINPS